MPQLKIAFINPNSGSKQFARPPLGLLFIASVCKNAGYSVRIIDANALDLSIEQIANQASDCDVIGLTAMTPTICDAYQIADALSDKTIILGGVHASVFPAECANTGLFDAVVVGESEKTILKILTDIKQNKLQKIYQSVDIIDLNQIPLPDYSLLDLSLYHARYPHADRTPWTIGSTSRGCPYRCTFCYKGVSGSVFHAMAPERMLEMINNMQLNHGIKDITFYDDIFTLDKSRVQEFCQEIINQGIDLTWTCESRVNLADPETLSLMAEAGCRLIYYGIESGSQRILDNLCKGIDLAKVKYAVEATQECSILAAGYFMLGCPGETHNTIQQTINFAKHLKIDHAQFSVCSPLPGSKLYQDYINMGYPEMDFKNYKYLADCEKPMFTSEELSRDDIENAVREANEMFTKERVK